MGFTLAEIYDMTKAQMDLFNRGYEQKQKDDAIMACNIAIYPHLKPQEKKKLIEQLRN